MHVLLDGELLPASEARVPILDRGFLFGDGVYEVVRFFNGVGVQMPAHAARLRRSLAAVRIEGFDAGLLPALCERLLAANGLADASVYLQVTRGSAGSRSHLPPAGLRPTVVAIPSPLPSLAEFVHPEPMRATLEPDQRWRRCDIKAIGLLPNVLAMMHAAEHGAHEAILHADGLVREGASSSIFVLGEGRLRTPPTDCDPPILPGITQHLVFAARDLLGIEVEQAPIRVDELRHADEVFLTSARRILAPITHVDDVPVGDGTPGPTTAAVFERLRQLIAAECGIRLAGSGDARRDPAESSRS